jgi:hypothetical protein
MASRFTDDPHGPILVADGATLARLFERRMAELLPPSPPQDAMVRWDSMRPGSEPPPRERKLDTAPAASVDWDARIRAAIAEERAFLVEAIGSALAEMLDTERKEANAELSDEVRRLRIELAETQTTLSELRQLIASDRAKIVEDLPNPLVPRRVELN